MLGFELNSVINRIQVNEDKINNILCCINNVLSCYVISARHCHVGQECNICTEFGLTEESRMLWESNLVFSLYTNVVYLCSNRTSDVICTLHNMLLDLAFRRMCV